MVNQDGFCTECGAAVSATDKFCAGCGHILGGGVPAPSTTPPLTPRRPPPRNWRSAKLDKILLVGLLLVGSCNVAVLVNAPQWPESAEEYGCETVRLLSPEKSCSKYRKQVGLAGEVWTPPMMDYMRTVFMTDCQGLVLSDPGLGSVAELFSATPLGVCVCATEFVMSNWTPVEFVKAGERPSTFGYELGGGITACLTERADYLTERAD